MKRELKARYALLREAQVREICEKVGEDHFQEIQRLKAETTELLERNGKLGLDYRDL